MKFALYWQNNFGSNENTSPLGRCFSYSGVGKMGREEQGIDKQRYCVIPRTLILIFADREVLLLKGAASKKRWAGRYNGLGGHVERGEDVLSAAKRELYEESGLADLQLHLCGTVFCDVEESWGVAMYVYKGDAEKTGLQPSEEGTLEWVPVSGLESMNIVDDMRVIIPRVFAWTVGDEPFSATNVYDDKDQLITTFFE
jgi:8-oxo-dGTP diphosphatase